jgi:hypothetical protein
VLNAPVELDVAAVVLNKVGANTMVSPLWAAATVARSEPAPLFLEVCDSQCAEELAIFQRFQLKADAGPSATSRLFAPVSA